MAPAAETQSVGQSTDSTATFRMAVTQQLVRLSESEIRRCATDVLELKELVSFELTAAADTLDLDWASAGLGRLASAYAVEVANAMRILLDGAALVSSEYPEGPPGQWVYSQIKWSSATQVATAAGTLARVDPDHFVRPLHRSRDLVVEFLGASELPDDPPQYYADRLRSLREFACGASARGLAMAMWWD
jgi:hypothetical protein